MTTDATTDTPGYAPGVQVRIRDEQWLVRTVTNTRHDGWMLEVTGVSSFVRDTEAVFYSRIDDVTVLRPEATVLVLDPSPHHRRGRLFLEAVIRKTALPQTEHGLALASSFLMHRQVHQFRPAELALSARNPQPRILIADVVGLGKTLEIGLLLAELIRRGRGERILVVSPAHVLEQFQRELWTRFSIPLVRLDSTGIQRLQQEIPAGRNPFAYFKRAIISVDTLKTEDYAHHLEITDWDAVVIDEAHNLVNVGTRNNSLAHTLARRCDALILASATPHNGNRTSFAELITLLDEAAIADPNDYDPHRLEHLYIRRTKVSPEVRDAVAGKWADRGPSLPVLAPATPEERAVLAELADRWVRRDGARAVGPRLFAWTLFKAFLSSPSALRSTIDTRLKTLERATSAQVTQERAALHELRDLVDMIDAPAKLDALVAALREIGVGPGSDTRVVVFSESVPTLTWLADVVAARLGFPELEAVDPNRPWHRFGGVVALMHGDATNVDEQKDIVSDFGLREHPVRLLFTGDIASEGVNLHQQCHQLVHVDLPWSLIRIEQRNGRIDRYGQRQPPQFRAVVLTSDVTVPGPDGEPMPFDDRLVGAKLLRREEEAHRIEGSADAVTSVHRPRDADERLTRDLIAGRTVEASLAATSAPDLLASLLGTVTAGAVDADVATADVPSVFASTEDFFDEALRSICPTSPEAEMSLRRDEDGTIAFEPPPDLAYRFRALPRSYLREQDILGSAQRAGRIRMTFSTSLADRSLQAARDSGTTQWPRVSYVSPVHPVLEWATDKVLAELRHDQAFVLAAAVDEPVFLVQGIRSNALGRPTVVEWMAVRGLPRTPRVEHMDSTALRRFGVGPTMPGRSTPRDLPGLQKQVPAAIEEARQHLARRADAYAARVAAMITPFRERVQEWRQAALFGADEIVARRTALADALESTGAPLLRLLAVLEPDR